LNLLIGYKDKSVYIPMDKEQKNVDHKNFDNLVLNKDILKGLYLNGFNEPSSIQIKGIESINSEKDCIIQSQSGTGKTATFLIGVFNNLFKHPGNKILILSPTRELANQTYNVASKLIKHSKVSISLCIGGTEIKNISSDIIIGTIGRVLHMIEDKKLQINNITNFVIDEADNMANEKDCVQLNKLINMIPTEAQKILISATLTHSVFKITDRIMKNPIKLLLKNQDVAVDLISQFYIDVEVEENKFDVFLDIYNLISTTQAIIFCNTISKVQWLAEQLKAQNFSITTIHSKMTQSERNSIVQEFRDGKTRLLLTTDLLARGIDVQQINLVICFDMPPDKETYIHRIGRCGRFNKKGVSISFIKMNDNNEMKLLNMMKHTYKINIKEMPENIDEFL
jgi:superfamily II DNA/RNA helicase